MKIYSGFDNIDKADSVITVGTFDGVHKGHGRILCQLSDIARKENLRSVVATIHPHPQIVLGSRDRNTVRLLTNIDERALLISKFNIDSFLIIPFTIEFANTSPESFIRNYLSNIVGLRKILIGYDHMFGKNRKGNEDLLKGLSKELNFGVEKVFAHEENDIIVSSTKIRNALTEGDIDFANSLLGYYYFVRGIVSKGDGRGRTIGFPTANIQYSDPDKLIPPIGVYFVKSYINGNDVFGMANIGTRPTFSDSKDVYLEVHFLNFSGDLYGLTINIEFLEHLRTEKKFSSKNELIEQLNIDKEYCLLKAKTFCK